MGSRGTFSKGIIARDERYQVVGYIEDAEIIKYNGINHRLPEESYTSNKYMLLDDFDNFYELRVYGDDHKLQLEIAYHREPNVSKVLKKVLHYHIYTDIDGVFDHGDAVEIKKGDVIYEKYKKYFKGINI